MRALFIVLSWLWRADKTLQSFRHSHR